MQSIKILTLTIFLFGFGLWVFLPKVVFAQTGFLGLQVQGLNPEATKALGLSKPSGVLIKDVAIGEPGAIAGIRRGDLIISFNNKSIRTFRDLITAVGSTKPNQKVRIIFKDGEREAVIK